MIKSGITAFLPLLSVLPWGSLGATLVRREKESSVAFLRRDKPQIKEDPCSSCGQQDYLPGKSKTKNQCRHPSNETMVTTKERCRYAANKAGAWHGHDAHFEVTVLEWNKLHPAGCFHAMCKPCNETTGICETSERDCYFFNDGDESIINESSSQFVGTPICMRDHIEDGATDAEGGCPNDEFSVIMNQSHCHDLCDELNMFCTAQFHIGVINYTKHNAHPTGCFKSHNLHANESGDALDHLYFNSHNSPTHGNVTGTVLCEVTTPHTWPDNSVDSGSKDLSQVTE